MKKLTKIIGISGVASCGKDTFASIFENECNKIGKTIKILSLARALKKDCEQFIKEKFGFNVWTEDRNIKEIFRPLLVISGDIQRKRTNGRYWIDILNKEIEAIRGSVDYILITDVRYSIYDKDEAQWIRDELNGVLVHLTKELLDGEILKPANDHEKLNNPILYNIADFKIIWKEQKNKENLLENQELIGHVQQVLNKI